MKIICIGHNYRAHCVELGNPIPEKPVFFCKPDTALLLNQRPFFHPAFSENIHYETEVVVKINRLGKHIQTRFASTYYDEISLGFDFTARDLQAECSKKGQPWEIAKAFDNSAAIGSFISKKDLGDLDKLSFYLLKNGEKVQRGNTSDLIFSIDEIIAYISQFFTLKIGDLIFTGTPSGVGKIKIGDRLEAYLEDRLVLKTHIK